MQQGICLHGGALFSAIELASARVLRAGCGFFTPDITVRFLAIVPLDAVKTDEHLQDPELAPAMRSAAPCM